MLLVILVPGDVHNGFPGTLVPWVEQMVSAVSIVGHQDVDFRAWLLVFSEQPSPRVGRVRVNYNGNFPACAYERIPIYFNDFNP